jgi:hypothetical protein
MRNVLKSMFRFSWAMSLFGARQAVGLLMPPVGDREPDTATAFEMVSKAAQKQMGGSLNSIYETGDRIQSGVLDMVLGFFAGGEQSGRDDSANEWGAGAPRQNTEAAPLSTELGLRGEKDAMSAAGSARSISVRLSGTTQGPFWPPSEVVDQEGNFILIGGFILTEVSPGKVVPIPNERGVIVSKETKPPLRDGKEDFSNPLGAPYQIIRELDLGPNGKDWELLPYSLSAGPFVGDFGGGRPRVPATGHSRYNLNANPLWNKVFLPVGHEYPHFQRPSYRLDQVPILRLDEIPRQISIGVRVNNKEMHARSGDPESPRDFRKRQPITLRDLLAGQGRLWITPLPSGEASSSFTGARFDFSLEGLLPHSLYGFWALHAASLLAPTDPNFILPVPLAVPNLIITDRRGSASASFELQNPFPDPASDAVGNRLVAIAVIYHSDFQNWGAALSGIATGVNAHTVMSANLSNLPNLFITRQPS